MSTRTVSVATCPRCREPHFNPAGSFTCSCGARIEVIDAADVASHAIMQSPIVTVDEHGALHGEGFYPLYPDRVVDIAWPLSPGPTRTIPEPTGEITFGGERGDEGRDYGDESDRA